jgi:phosphoglycerol transferase MdoB-like AlkP superfamily enzyme
MILGRDFDWSVWTLFALFWQDTLFALCFYLCDVLLKRRRIMWLPYALVTLYVATNVPLVRVLATPLTPNVLNAAGSALSDSIKHHVTPEAIVSLLSVVLVSVGAPFLVLRFKLRSQQKWLLLASASIVCMLGQFASARSDMHGLDRNILYAFASGLRPRITATNVEQAWRRPLFAESPAPGPNRLRGVAQGRNVILVSLESTGARHLKPWGAERDVTPNLTKLTAESILLESCYAVYPESIKGLFSVLCSADPALDSRPEDYENLRTRSLPDLLRESGYTTALFHSGRFAYLGMSEVVKNRGFNSLFDAGDIGGNRESSFGIDEEPVIDALLNWIDCQHRPFFVHYLPIAGHHPYLTPSKGPFSDGTEIGRYRNALHYSDQAIGRLIAGLKNRGLYDNTFLIFYGDHGEAFGEHEGNYGHSLFIYEENVRVPAIFCLPGVIESEIRLPGVFSLTDLAPTVCDLLAVPIPSDFKGMSVLNEASILSLFYTDYSLALLGLREADWKFIYELEGGRSRLYNLSIDPSESKNLAGLYVDRSNQYAKRVQQWASAQRGVFSSRQQAGKRPMTASRVSIEP